MIEVVEPKRPRGTGSTRRRKDRGDGDDFVNDGSDLGDWVEGGETRKKKVFSLYKFFMKS